MQLCAHATVSQKHQRHELQRADRGAVVIAEKNRGGLDVDAQVVVTIDNCVFGVVGDGPTQISDEQQPRLHRQRVRLRGVSHGDAPAKCRTEHDLWQMCKAFRKWIACSERSASETQ